MQIYKYIRFILILLILLNTKPVKSQFVEIGIMGGASNYSGDLSNESIAFKETHIAVSMFGRYNFSNKWAVKGFAGYGKISGDDKNYAEAPSLSNPDGNFQYWRNLNFYSNIFEFSVQAEYNLLPNDLQSNSSRPFVPYIFAGIGIVNFNPKTTLNGTEQELQPLGTEGQGTTIYNNLKKYDLTVYSIPIGAGFRQKIGESFFLGIEAGVRFTGSNYIDDVGGKYADARVVGASYGQKAQDLSDRSIERSADVPPITHFNEFDPRSDRKIFTKDLYFMGGITLSYIFRGKGMDCPNF
ncbi:MAG: DUF6089 family protein [Bacteroidetes bacterium]|nr:DUF6089 family protein [Bacteroidota bacterium]